MELHLDSGLWLPRQAPRGRMAVYDCRTQAPLFKMYHKVMIPPLDALNMPPNAMWIGEAREEGDWNTVGGLFRLRPHLVEAGMVVQPLPWMPGLCFLMINMQSWVLQLHGGMVIGDFIIAPGYNE